MSSAKCRCGKTHEECAAEWDQKLGIVDHSSDAPNRTSSYHQNIRRINQAKAEGLDVYHHQLNARKRK